MLHVLVIVASLLLLASTASAMRGFVVQQVERGARERWTATRHAILAREATARVLFALLSPFDRFEPRPPAPTAGVPVVLIPDPAVGRAALFFLGQFLRARGVDVWSVHLPDDDAPLADRAEQLERRLNAYLRRARVERVDLVGFGTGGLVAAWMLRHRDGARTIRRLVTLGTPWRGTRMAVFLSGYQGLEVRPGSHDLDDLTPPSVPTLSVWCPDDPEVVPAENGYADLDHAVAIEGAGHLGLLLSARACRAVLAGLRDAAPEPA